jgi:hypothetical protein
MNQDTELVNPKPINQKSELHDWNLRLGSLRLEVFTPGLILHPEEEDKSLLALVDDCGRIYPRERALMIVERLMSFYNSVTDEQIDDFNCEIDAYEGGKVGLRMGLHQTLFENRRAMRTLRQLDAEKQKD